MTLFALTSPLLRAPVYVPGLAIRSSLPDLSPEERSRLLRLPVASCLVVNGVKLERIR